MNAIIQNQIPQIKIICEKHKVESFFLFGSAATSEFNLSSDLDFLVKFTDNVPLLDYADNYFSLQENLELLFNRKIDLVVATSLKNPYLISEIEKTKTTLYAA